MASWFLPLYVQLLVFENYYAKTLILKMIALTDGWIWEPAATHFSTSPRRCFGDLSWAEEVVLDVNSEYQPGNVSEVIRSLLLLQRIWSPLSSEHLYKGGAYIQARFWGKFQSSATLPPIAPREVNQYLMGILARANNVPDMDLSDWSITCTKFRPRKWK